MKPFFRLFKINLNDGYDSAVSTGWLVRWGTEGRNGYNRVVIIWIWRVWVACIINVIPRSIADSVVGRSIHCSSCSSRVHLLGCVDRTVTRGTGSGGTRARQWSRVIISGWFGWLLLLYFRQRWGCRAWWPLTVGGAHNNATSVICVILVLLVIRTSL